MQNEESFLREEVHFIVSHFSEMTAITPVGPNIQNFEVPGVIAVISPNPNFHDAGIIKPISPVL